LDRNADVVQSFDKQFVAPSATSTKTKFPNRGWFGKMEASSANNLLKQETGRSHDLLSYRNSALAGIVHRIVLAGDQRLDAFADGMGVHIDDRHAVHFT
jgi:hypothetical protein